MQVGVYLMTINILSLRIVNRNIHLLRRAVIVLLPFYTSVDYMAEEKHVCRI